MGFSGGILTYPFTKIAANGNGDLQQALGTGSLSQAAMMTGQAGTINKWSKYKPFRHSTIYTDRYNGPGQQVTTQREAAIRAANFGLVAPTMYNNIESTRNTEWTYEIPRANSTDVLQALDFEHYYKNAVPPAASPGDVTFYRPLQDSFEFTSAMSQILIEENIKWVDLGQIKDWYLCLYIKNSNGQIYYIKTANNTILNGGLLPLTRQEANTIYSAIGTGPHFYYLCASQGQNNTFVNPYVSTNYLALPALNTAAMEGTIRITDQVVANITITRVSNASPSDTNLVRSFIDASPYIGPYLPGSDSYFLLQASKAHSVHFAFDITGVSGRDATFSKNNFSISLNSTFWGTTSSFIPEKILDASGNEYSSITIPAGQTARYFFVLPYGAMNYNGNTRQDFPTAGQQKSVTVTVSYNTYSLGNDTIRLGN